MTYEVSQKGSDFIDETARHWENPGVSKDDVWDWLWEIRETGNFEASSRRFVKKVGKEGAERVLNWAHSHGYLVTVEESEEDIIDVGAFRVASDTGGKQPITDESHITQLRKNLQKPETLDLGVMSREDYISHAKSCPECRPMIEKKLGYSVEGP